MPPSVREARDRAYRDLILGSAEAVFAAEGFHGARMARVAEVAGVSLKTIYGQFRSKDALHRAIFEWRSTELASLVSDAFPAGGNALELVRAVIDPFVRFFCERPAHLRMQLSDGAAWSLGRFERAEHRTIWSEGFELATRFVARGMDDGLLVRGDPERAVKVMTAIYQTILADWLERGMDRSPEQLTAEIEQTFLRAFCVPDAGGEGD